jgi:uncharacterized metal-binding protein
MFFNPRYGLLGMLSYPYWFFFEFLAPIIEFLGTIGLILYCAIYSINWQAIIIIIGVVSIGILYSIFAIMMEVLTYNQYNKRQDILHLVLVAILEPIVFHPFVVWSSIRGNIDLLRKNNSWGEMTRQGFATEKKATIILSNEK